MGRVEKEIFNIQVRRCKRWTCYSMKKYEKEVIGELYMCGMAGR